MAITAEQRETRKKYLGASDVAAVLGLHPYCTPADVWLEKTQDLKPLDENESISIGNDSEPMMRRWLSKTVGEDSSDELPTYYADNGFMLAHPDWVGKTSGRGGELKANGDSREYGEDGSDQVPDMHMVQVAAQMLCMKNTDVAYLAALLGDYRRLVRRHFVIPYSRDLCCTIEDECGKWWDKHYVAGVMPDSAPSLEVVKRIKPRPGVVVPLDPALASAYHAAKEQSKIAASVEKDARARLEAALAGADGGECDGWQVEFKNVNVKAYSVAARTDRRLTCKPAGVVAVA